MFLHLQFKACGVNNLVLQLWILPRPGNEHVILDPFSIKKKNHHCSSPLSVLNLSTLGSYRNMNGRTRSEVSNGKLTLNAYTCTIMHVYASYLWTLN